MSRGFNVLTNFAMHFTLCLIFRRFWPIYDIHIYIYIYIYIPTTTDFRISVIHKVIKSCRSKMATLTHDAFYVHGASSLYIKTCWQSLYMVFPTGDMGESSHQPKICSFTPSPPNFYSSHQKSIQPNKKIKTSFLAVVIAPVTFLF